jgi:endonuclease/exonuclease/phosphatase (EEP) superfamily protein YafD
VQALLRTTRSLLLGAAALYGAALAGLALLWAANIQLAWWVTLASMFALPLFAPLLLLLPAALFIRSWPLRGGAALALAAFLLSFGGQLLPPARAASTGTPLRVMTFNHLFANPRVADVIAAIRAQNADVVALQELSEPVAAALDRDLRVDYPYQYLRPFDNQQGLGIISRFPLLSKAETENNIRGLQVSFEVGGQNVTLIGLHLGAPAYRVRRFGGIPLITGYDASSTTRQVGRLGQLVDQINGPLVVMGDFNTSDREPRYRELAARMHDAFRETNWGLGFSFPDHKRFGPLTLPFPLLRIDYVWSKNGVLPTAAHVECNNIGADHCFVVADLRIEAPAP